MKSKKEIIEEYLNHKMFMQLNNMSGAMSDEEYRMAMGSPFAGDRLWICLKTPIWKNCFGNSAKMSKNKEFIKIVS